MAAINFIESYHWILLFLTIKSSRHYRIKYLKYILELIRGQLGEIGKVQSYLTIVWFLQ